MYMHMHPGFFTREEEKTTATFVKNSRTYLWSPFNHYKDDGRMAIRPYIVVLFIVIVAHAAITLEHLQCYR